MGQGAKDPASDLAKTRAKTDGDCSGGRALPKYMAQGLWENCSTAPAACAALGYGHQFACVLERGARSEEDRCKASVSACCVKQRCVYAQRIIVCLPN